MDAEQRALLPCPFCGGEARRMKGDGVEFDINVIGCTGCNTNVSGLEDTPESAAAAWNTRALTQAQPGWRVVPVVPTPEMLNAATDATRAGSDMDWTNRSPQKLFGQGYAAMLAAAPAPQQGEGE